MAMASDMALLQIHTSSLALEETRQIVEIISELVNHISSVL